MNEPLLNGKPATVDDLRALAVGNYGHFTSMQVRQGAVQGLELHWRRLQAGTRELFGSELDLGLLAGWVRQVLAASVDCTLRITVFSRQFNHRDPGVPLAPDVLLTVAPASQPQADCIRIKAYEFQRPLPQIKHVGTFPLFHYRRLARGQGYDDALFVNGQGLIVEGSVWNLGFWDGSRVLWPQAPALRGTAEALIQQGLTAAGIRQALAPLTLEQATAERAAFACNASGIQRITRIDGHAFRPDPELDQLLVQALASRPWDLI